MTIGEISQTKVGSEDVSVFDDSQSMAFGSTSFHNLPPEILKKAIKAFVTVSHFNQSIIDRQIFGLLIVGGENVSWKDLGSAMLVCQKWAEVSLIYPTSPSTPSP